MNRIERQTDDVLFRTAALTGLENAAMLGKLAEDAKACLDARRPKPRRQKRGLAPGRSKADRKAAEDRLYASAWDCALLRSMGEGQIARCEVWENGQRCVDIFTLDPDHVLGGAYRKERERLGPEGLRVTCRRHHDQKHLNTPTHRFWLDEAKEHAIRIGARRLLALVEKAIARDELKHPEARGAPEEKP